MKKVTPLLLLLCISVFLISCKSEPDPSVQEVQLKKLVKTWTLTSVQLDGVDKKTSTEYNNFKISISGVYNAATPDAEYTYSVSGRPQLSPWPASGKWKFGTASPQTQIIRDAGSTDKELTLTYSIQENPLQLTISFNYQGAGIANRTSIVKGEWEMVFN